MPVHRLCCKNKKQTYYYGFDTAGNNIVSGFFIIIYFSQTRRLVKVAVKNKKWIMTIKRGLG